MGDQNPGGTPLSFCLHPASPHLYYYPLSKTGAAIHWPPVFLVRTKENGSDRDPLHPDHLSKRSCTLSPAQRCSPSNGLPHPTPPPPPHYRLEDMAMAHHFRDSYRHPDPRELRERHRPLGKWCGSHRPLEVWTQRVSE